MSIPWDSGDFSSHNFPGKYKFCPLDEKDINIIIKMNLII